MPALKSRGASLNAPDYADRVNLIKKIKVDGSRRFAPVVPEANGRLKDRARVNGQIETRPERAYYIEWRERDKRCRVSVAREAAIAEARRKATELGAIREGLLAAPEPERKSLPRFPIGQAIDDYCALCAFIEAPDVPHVSLHSRYPVAKGIQEEVRRRRDASGHHRLHDLLL